MTARAWSERELAEFVRGRVLTVYSEGSVVPVPDSLLALGGEPNPCTDTLEVTDRIHPDDLAVVADMTIEAYNSAGKVAASTYRYRWGDDWMRARCEAVFLFDEPIRGLLTAVDLEPLTAGDDHAVGPRPERAGDDGAVHWMLFTVTVTGVVISAEGAVRELLGRDPATVAGLDYRDFYHPDSHGDLYRSWIELLHRPESTRVARRCFVRPDGTEQWAETALVSRLRPGGAGDVLVFAVDITDRMAQEEELRRTQEELRMLAEQVPAAVFRADDEGRITFTNHRWRDLLGPLADVERLGDLAVPGDREQLDPGLPLPGPDGRRVEITAAHGRRRLAVNLRAVRDEMTGRTTFVGTVDDVTATSMLRHQADHDDLTGLLSRRAFEERVSRMLATCPGRGAVGFIDLDRFKDVNDLHGHDAGDAVLVALAQRLRRTVRDADYVGRYGGDEFVVFCPDTDDADAVAERLGRVCGELVTFAGGTWMPAASIGVALVEEGETVSDLVRRADQAMFAVKRARRVRVDR